MRRYCAYCLSYFSNPNHPVSLGGPATPLGRDFVNSLTPDEEVRAGNTTYSKDFILGGGMFPRMLDWVDFMDRFGDSFFYRDPMGAPVRPFAVTTVAGYDVCVDHVPSYLRMGR